MSISGINASQTGNLDRYIVQVWNPFKGGGVRPTVIGKDESRRNFTTGVASHPLIRAANEEHRATVDRFINGRATAEDVETNVRAVFQTVINANLANGLISGNDPEEFRRIIHEAHHIMRLWLGPQIDQAHNLQGLEIAKRHGLVKDGAHLSSWVFYNSDFYFLERDLIDIMKSVAHEFFDKHGVEDRNLDNTGIRWSEMNFNVRWNQRSVNAGIFRRGAGVTGGIVDVRISPPPNFSFFFGEMLYEQMIRLRENVYQMTGNSTHIRVMIINGQAVARESTFGGDRFNARDFWGDCAIDEALRGFLGNFEVFSNIVHRLRNPNPYLRTIL